ncbi:MAG: DUF3179 domain-containing (seleno)protein [Bacteroidota bacterium]
MLRISGLLLIFFGFIEVQAQFSDFQFVLSDQETSTPISDAHVFVSNSSFGAISDKNGNIQLSIPSELKEDLIVSHVAYDTKVLRYSTALRMTKNDTLFLLPNGINMDAIVVEEKRSKEWKKKFKKFKEVLIGTGKEASKCKILNPEVLRFSSENEVFTTTAIDMISIQNDHLGYRIEFLLKNLTIEKNGSKKFIGHAKFVDISTKKNRKKVSKNREKIYKQSPRHFFKHLIKNDLETGKYKIRTVSYKNGNFKEQSIPEVEDIVYYDSTSQHYLVTFDKFLEIKHTGIKKIYYQKSGVRQGGLERNRLNPGDHGSSSRLSHPISYLYKLTPSLIINKHGNVVNHKAMQEYGFWADQRMAKTLPLDYSIDNSKSYVPYHKAHSKKTESQKKIDSIPPKSSLSVFKDIIYGDQNIRIKAFDHLDKNWEMAYLAPLLDLMRINQDDNIHKELTALLKEKVGVSTYYEGLQSMWEQESTYDNSYAAVKAELYQHVDPKFKAYFEARDNLAKIGLDEIVWGGVFQDGIPPLRYPNMIPAEEAGYLSNDDIVFAISIGEEHRAYPKRILAWHEFFVDKIANEKIAGVYCTLCGTMIAYNMVHNGNFHDLGTSGFLYKSNKLMYDKETQSLWSTIEGKPVLGPLTRQNIELISYSTVTTTWGKWKTAHPNTKVLSLNTGYDRNYDEGEAYKSYFTTDDLMFPVPKIDRSLKNKDEVLVIRANGYKNDPLAISIKYLKKKRLIKVEIADQSILVLAEKDGWSRAYSAANINFISYKNGTLKDSEGNPWRVEEDQLVGPKGEKLERIPSHNAFWFAWFNAYPHTRLIK